MVKYESNILIKAANPSSELAPMSKDSTFKPFSSKFDELLKVSRCCSVKIYPSTAGKNIPTEIN